MSPSTAVVTHVPAPARTHVEEPGLPTVGRVDASNLVDVIRAVIAFKVGCMSVQHVLLLRKIRLLHC